MTKHALFRQYDNLRLMPLVIYYSQRSLTIQYVW